MRFEPAPEYQVFPTRERPLKPYEAAVRAARETQPLIEELDPDVVVADILTLAAGLAGRDGGAAVGDARPARPADLRARASRRTRSARGCRARRSARALWRALDPIVRARHRARPRRAERDAARGSGCRRSTTCTAGSRASSRSSRRSRSSSTRARRRGRAMRVTGPLMWERPADDVELPPGDEPLVLVAPSTSQDREQRMLRAALAGLADEPVRVLATTNRRGDAGRPACRPAERARRRLALLRAHDAALRGGRLPRRPRHGRARAGERRAAGGLPGGGRHGARTRRAWRGRARACRCRAGW